MKILINATCVGPTLAIALMTATAAAACTDSSDSNTSSLHPNPDIRPARQSFWDPLRVVGLEVEGYSSLRAMADSSDMIARGRIVAFGVGDVIQGDSEEDIVTYGEATVEISDLVKGNHAESTVNLQFLLPYESYVVSDVIEQQALLLPAPEAVFFLRQTGPQRNRLTWSAGLWVDEGGGVTPPLALDWRPQSGGSPPAAVGVLGGLAADVAAVRSLDQLVARVR